MTVLQVVLDRPSSAVLRLTRPWFWPLGWGGAYVGAVLASRTWLPPLGTVPAALAVAAVLGPLTWGAVLTVNDLHDLDSDRHNPRKATAPLVTGALGPADLSRWHRRFAVAAVAVALVVGPVFAIGTAGVLLLGWLYSAPPFRLKARAGADVAINAFAIGVLGPLAGWCLYRPPTGYPLIMIFLGFLLGAALYLPTTVIDVEADRIAGNRTAAVTWTPEVCYRLGVLLWTGAIVLWLVCCRLELLAPGQASPAQAAMAPVLLVVYCVLARTPSITRMAIVAATFGVSALDFLATCVAS